ncbi:hypothetical protein Hypma_008255 [Hypsizygus marmoreus]|uniref:Uncharacterized protein n=1 Tax=Hypsizygus marmoreus TaxID=39966 RepID=A0A369JQQ1_HYPMA|nr:hypothetical protein Hypma_008255 [Hypsizygus marmoreus]
MPRLSFNSTSHQQQVVVLDNYFLACPTPAIHPGKETAGKLDKIHGAGLGREYLQLDTVVFATGPVTVRFGISH